MLNGWSEQTINSLRQRIYRRYPASRLQKFTRRNLFIFPSRSGFSFLILLAVLWLLGTNYSNNLILLLAFFLTSLFVICILHTFANLAGVEIEYLQAQPAFQGDDAEIKLVFRKKGKRGRENILTGWPFGSRTAVDLLDKNEEEITLFVPAKKRGWYDPGRLLVETYFPLGLFRCWMYPSMDVNVLVYPKPVKAGPLPSSGSEAEQGEQLISHGSEEFDGYRNYQPGHSLRDVAWKQFARGAGLHSKEFVSHADNRLWLTWDDLSGMDREARLSRLCHWVLELSKVNREFGLKLPGIELKPGSGMNHKLDALKHLALFEEREVV